MKTYPMRIYLCVDTTTPEHVYCTVFMSGANCGLLVMRHKEYSAFGRALILGGLHIEQPRLDVSVDAAQIPARTKKSAQ